MSTKLIAKGLLPEVGEWINKDTIFNDGICGHPRRVVKVSKTRVYYADHNDEDSGRYCDVKSIRFSSTTKEEATRLHNLSEKKISDMTAARKEISAKYRAIINELVESK